MTPETNVKLAAICNGLQEIAAAIRDETNAIKAEDHVAIIKHFDAVRIGAELIKESREVIKEITDLLSTEIVPDAMRLAGVKTTTVEGVGRVTVSHRYSCSMVDKTMGFKWLRDNGHEGLITETVNSSTLSAFAKNLLEEEGKELPVDIFKTGTMPYTSITKVR